MKRSVFVRYLLSYMLAGMVLILAFSSVFYYINIMNARRNHDAQALRNLQYALEKIDSLAEQMRSTSLSIADVYFSDKLPSTQTTPYFNLTDEQILIRRLEEEEEEAVPARSAVFYERGSAEILTSSGPMAYGVFEKSMRGLSDPEKSGLFTQLNASAQSKVIHLKPSAGATETKTAFLFPIAQFGQIPRATIAFFFDQSALLSVFEEYLGAIDGNLYLFDGANPVMASQPHAVPGGERDAVLRQKGTGIYEADIEGVPYVYLRGFSRSSDRYAVVLIARATFYAPLKDMGGFLGITVMLFVLLGWLLAFFLSRFNYRPIRELVARMQSGDPAGSRDTGNELRYIRQRYDDMEDKSQKLADLIDIQQPIIADHCLLSLLTGKLEREDQARQQLRRSGINLNRKHFFVMVLVPVQTKDMDIALQAALPVLNAHTITRATFHSIEIITQGHIAILVNLEEEPTKDVRRDLGLQTIRLMEDAGMRVKLGISQACEALLGLPELYTHARVTVSDFMKEPTGLLLFDDVKPETEEVYPISGVLQALYLQGLRDANKAAALSALDAILKSEVFQNNSVVFMRYLCFDLINTMIKAAAELGCKSTISEIKELSSFSSMEEYREKITAATRNICDQAAALKTREEMERLEHILEYIAQEYTSSEISLTALSERFQMSPAYVSKFFKQEMGVTFIQYLSNLRLEYVKGRLAGGDDRIADIVRDAGYIDTASYMRKFKQQTGLTMGQFRKQAR